MDPVFRTSTHSINLFPPVVARFLITLLLPIPPTNTLPLPPPPPKLSDVSFSIFLPPRSVPASSSSCVPQPRLSGTIFRSVSHLNYYWGEVVTVKVGHKVLQLAVVPISIYSATRIGHFPPPNSPPHLPCLLQSPRLPHLRYSPN